MYQPLRHPFVAAACVISAFLPSLNPMVVYEISIPDPLLRNSEQ
jgi:hypothetical protein